MSRTKTASFALAFAVVGTYLLSRSFAATPNISIDYSHTIQISPLAFSVDETGYQTPNVMANDSLEVQRFQALQLGYMRMHLIWSTPGDPTSKIVCGGGGCDTGPTGDQWISSIKQVGAVPVVIVNESGASDAANMVKHFNINPSTGNVDPTLPNYVKYWLIGNEPDLNQISVTTYSNDFNADNDAMKAVDPNIKVGGPTTAWLDDPFVPTFIQNSGSRVDFIDFHGYPSVPSYTYADFFNWAQGTGSGISKVKSWLNQYVPLRASQIFVEVGEWSMDPSNLYATYGPNGRNLTKSNFNVVWGADVIGNIIQNGGVAMHYGTKGNVIAWNSGYRTDYDTGQQVYLNLDDPQAPYHAYGMWTGEGLFRGFGTALASVSTTLSNIDVFASDNSKNIVVINKDQTNDQTGVFSLNGVSSGTVDIWQKNQNILFNDPPTHLGSISFTNGTFSYALPHLSATTFVVSPDNGTTPTVSINAVPTTITNGQSSTLNWSSTNASSCSASGAWSGSQATSGSLLVSPSSSSTYTITCGGVSASATVTVNSVSAAVPGDCNGDGHVTIIDLSILLSYYGTAYAACDFNNDGIVNILDLSTLLSHYGT